MLVAPSEIFRRGFRSVLARCRADLEIVAELDRLDVRLVLRLAPDLLFADLEAPGVASVLGTRVLSRAVPATRIIALGTPGRTPEIEGVLAGASGYIVKSGAAADVQESLGRIVRADARARAADRSRPARRGGLIALSEREHNVFERVILGASSKEVAAELGISVKTIEKRRGSINAKLGARSTADLVRVASLLGLVVAGQ
jgi:DNA-binding NarL/FixJ family response regulator